MEDRTVRLVVDIDLGTEPIRGCIEGPDGRSRPFSGWLGLVSALESGCDGQGEQKGAGDK